MRMRPFVNLTFAVLLSSLAGSVLAQDTAATIPSSFVGTYDLTYGDFSNGSADEYFTDGESVTMVIKGNGSLCISGTTEISDPVFRNGNMAEAIWADGNGLEFAFSNIETEAFNEVNLMLDGSFAGQFSGSKSSSETSCTGSSGPSLSSSAQSMLDLAESLLSSALSGGGELKEVQGYVYRFYATSGAYVGFKDGMVFTYGGPFGSKLKARGSITQVTVALQNYEASITVDTNDNSVDVDVDVDTDDIDTGDVDISGNYDLTINGTIATVVGGIAAPGVDFSVTIQDIVAPDPSDTDEITNVLTDTLENVSGIQDLEITVINNTESQITFTVAFTAVQNGVTVEMELEYDYTR